VKTKKTKKTLKGKKKFSIIGIVAFAVVFVGIGAYFVYSSFATSNYPNCYVGENYSYKDGVYTGCPNIYVGTTRYGVVKVLKTEFNAICYTNGADEWDETNGTFGEKLKDVVKSFQRAHSLQVDGVVGPKTWQQVEKDYKNRKAAGTLNECG
jgi:peptidoglycan hydrolase-like protein with peptidoglycan-binding domain